MATASTPKTTESGSAEPAPEPAPITIVPIPQLTIEQKLLRILELVGNIEKKGENKAQNYKFVRVGDVVDAIRPKMVELGLLLRQTLVEHELVQAGLTQRGGQNWLSVVKIRFTWVDTLTGTILEDPDVFPGYGMDTGDKGIYKALTGAEKAYLMKQFLISTDDDPEADENVDRQQAADRAEGGTRVTRRASSPGQQRGGRSTVPTEAQVKALWAVWGEKRLGGADALKHLAETLNVDVSKVDPGKRGALLNFVQGLTSTQVGTLIRSLASTADASASAEGNSAEPVAETDGAESEPAGGTGGEIAEGTL